jgi:hypothetical protein
MTRVMAIGILGVALMALVGCETAEEHWARTQQRVALEAKRDARRQQDAEAQAREADWRRPVAYTYAQYSRIQPRMDLVAVEAILGGPGQELASNQIAGYRTVIYAWSNQDGSNLNVMLQDGRVIQKAQFGLR